MLLHTLIAAKDPELARRLHGFLSDQDAHLRVLAPGEDLWQVLGVGADLVIVSEELLGAAPANAIAEIRALPDEPEVVVLVEDSLSETRATLLAARAFAVVDRSASEDELANALTGIVRRRARFLREHWAVGPADSSGGLSDFSSESPTMREFLAFVRKVVNTDSTLVIQGETGVGKEFLARAIHAESPRRAGPFLPVNCSALAESLLESELFGHVEGAFTGAMHQRRGYFELAHRGTLFLDEVGELSPQIQVKLLRVLQDRRIQPVGGEEDLEVDVRLIAATNKDLVTEAEAGRFRTDLYYRLSVVTLEIPPLRARCEDIPGLVESNLEHYRILLRRPVRSVRPDALELLVNHAWPGNVRELKNVIERAVLLTEHEEITPADLPEEIRSDTSAPRIPEPGVLVPYRPQGVADSTEVRLERPFKEARRAVVDEFERAYLDGLLRRCNGRLKDVAETSGLNTRSLFEKMRRLGLRKEFYRLPRRRASVES